MGVIKHPIRHPALQLRTARLFSRTVYGWLLLVTEFSVDPGMISVAAMNNGGSIAARWSAHPDETPRSLWSKSVARVRKRPGSNRVSSAISPSFSIIA